MRIRNMLLTLLCVIGLSGCDVHQFPVLDDDGPEPIRLILDLSYATEMPLHTVVWYDSPSAEGSVLTSRSEPSYKLRHTVQIFAGADESRSLWSRSGPLTTVTAYRSITDGLPTQIELDLPDGLYTAMVWTDYVPADESALTFYHVDDFSEIRHPDLDNYCGSTDFLDAFRGETQFLVTDQSQVLDNVQTVHVDMHRPVAKFTVIATDVEKFIARSRAGDDSRESSGSRAFDLSDYYVRLHYTGYRPTAFNMFLNKPVDSALGISFPSEISLKSESEAHLAFDYVMVNGSEAKVDAAIRLLDRNDKVVAQSEAFRIPLMRGKHTEVRGDFLTASSTSGVTIVTKFDGEYNIEIH